MVLFNFFNVHPLETWQKGIEKLSGESTKVWVVLAKTLYLLGVYQFNIDILKVENFALKCFFFFYVG